MDNYEVFDRYISNIINNDKNFSHAYLFEVDSLSNFRGKVIDFAKILLCPSKCFSKNGNCSNCNICNLIDNNCFDDLIFVELDMVLKKEVIDNILTSFNSTSFNNSRRVYVIFGVENLNMYASNSILKFLEEPVDGVVAIFVTENCSDVLETIRSRCTHFILKNEVSRDDGVFKEMIDFIFMIEKNGLESIAFLKEYWFDKYPDKSKWILNLQYMIDIYMSMLDGDGKFDEEFNKNVIKINDMNTIIKKIKVLCDIKRKLKYNVNGNLIVDKLIIDMFS